MTRWQVLGFFTLCLLSSGGWLINDALSSPGTPVSGQGFRLLLAGLVGLAVWWLRRRHGLPSTRQCVVVSVASLGLVGFPFLLLTAAEGRVAATTAVLVFALTPVLLMVIGASAKEPMDLGLMAYGLAGVAGLMVLLPVQLPAGGAGTLGVGLALAAMVSVACCMVGLHRLLKGFPLGVALCSAGMGNGVLLLVAGAKEMNRWSVRVAGGEVLRCMLVDLPELMLLVWLTKAVAPRRLSARYLVAPALTVMEGLALVRPRFEVRTLGGLALLGIGACRVLFSESRQQETSLKLR